MTTPARDVDTAESTRKLQAAVDQLTKPSKSMLHRDNQPDELTELEKAWADRGFCDLKTYRAVTSGWGEVPSLWQQATWALTTGSESAGGNPSPLAQRSPADLDLMETMLTIRETIGLQLDGRRIKAKRTVPEQIRQLSAHLVGHEPEHVDWWEYRFAQWARLLARYLHAIETGPREVRLRNAPCPLCKTRTVTIDRDGEPVVVPPILIDFVDGWIRAATCTACTATWWRGNDLGDLANLLDSSDPSETMTA